MVITANIDVITASKVVITAHYNVITHKFAVITAPYKVISPKLKVITPSTIAIIGLCHTLTHNIFSKIQKHISLIRYRALLIAKNPSKTEGFGM